LLKTIKESREEFTKRLTNKISNKEFAEDFLENPGLCVETYFKKDIKNSHLHPKEDFTALLDQTLDLI
jgi:hypothetical protein